MIELALYIKRHNLKPEKVQDFIPGPMDVATCMYYTGVDPLSGERSMCPAASGSGGCNGRCCNTSSRKTTPTSARRWRRPIGWT